MASLSATTQYMAILRQTVPAGSDKRWRWYGGADATHGWTKLGDAASWGQHGSWGISLKVKIAGTTYTYHDLTSGAFISVGTNVSVGDVQGAISFTTGAESGEVQAAECYGVRNSAVTIDNLQVEIWDGTDPTPANRGNLVWTSENISKSNSSAQWEVWNAPPDASSSSSSGGADESSSSSTPSSASSASTPSSESSSTPSSDSSDSSSTPSSDSSSTPSSASSDSSSTPSSASSVSASSASSSSSSSSSSVSSDSSSTPSSASSDSSSTPSSASSDSSSTVSSASSVSGSSSSSSSSSSLNSSNSSSSESSSSAGSLLTPVLAITDKADGTGVTATITNSEVQHTVYVYYVPWGDDTWVLGGTRAGNGTLSISLDPGKYSFHARALVS